MTKTDTFVVNKRDGLETEVVQNLFSIQEYTVKREALNILRDHNVFSKHLLGTAITVKTSLTPETIKASEMMYTIRPQV